MTKIARVFKILAKVVFGCLAGIWKFSVFMINLIDGGHPPETHDHFHKASHYNLRSNEIDPMRFRDGLYPGDSINRGVSDR